MRLVVAIDGKKSADTALSFISESRYTKQTEIHLLHVIVPGFADVSVEGIPDVAAEEKEEEQVVLADMAKALKETLGVTEVSTEIREGEVAEVIAKACKEFKADEAIVPSHARHGFAKLWFGSIADEIVDAAPCTVIVLKMPQTSEH